MRCLLALSVLLLASCQTLADGRRDDTPTADAAVRRVFHSRLTSEGGSLRLNAIRIEIAAGAVAQPQEIAVEETGENHLRWDESTQRLEVGPAWAVNPGPAVIDAPVLVMISYADFRACLKPLESRLVILGEKDGRTLPLTAMVDGADSAVFAIAPLYSSYRLAVPADSVSCNEAVALDQLCAGGRTQGCGLKDKWFSNRRCTAEERFWSESAEGIPEACASEQVAPNVVEEGARLYRTQGCLACHGRDGKAAAFPLLAGQNAGYIYDQLAAFQSGERTHGRAPLMKVIAQTLTPREMKALAHYIQRMDSPDAPPPPEVVYDDALIWGAGSQVQLERALATPLPRTVLPQYLLLTIDHRNRQPMDSRYFYDFLGFDAGGTKIGVGLRYGLTSRWDAGLQRINGTNPSADAFNLDTKYRVAVEAGWRPDVAILAGLTGYSDPDRRDSWGGYGALILGESFLSRLYLSAGAMGHTNSDAPDRRLENPKGASAVFGSAHLRLIHELALTGEFNAPVSGSPGPGRRSRSIGWALGFKVITPRHSLALLASNTQFYGMDGLASGARHNPNRAVFGFSITREFSLAW